MEGKAARLATLGATLVLVLLWPCSSWSEWLADGNPVCTAPRHQYWPVVAPDGTGGVIVAWEDSRTPGYAIYAQRINADGDTMWAANGVSLVANPSIGERPAIASDGAGGAFAAWVDVTVYDGRKVFVQWIDSTGAIRWGDDGLKLTTGVTWEYDPAIIADGAGGAIVAWRVFEDGVYVQRIDASGAKVWAANGIDLTPGPGECFDPVLVSCGVGGAIIAWHRSDIYAQRVDAPGTVRWAVGGVPICTEVDDQREPKMIGLDDGGAIIVWKDGRSGNFDIYAQRITVKAGEPVWALNGVPVCVEPGRQQRPVIVTDNEDGAIVAWDDNRSDDGDIYCQRLNSLGSIEWAPAGVGVCTVTEWQERPQIAPDEADGAIITWHDRRSGVWDVYAQRVAPSGATMWWDQGTPVCTYSQMQTFPVVASDGTGGAFVAWADQRAGETDIYAQRVNQYGCPAMPECCAVPDLLDFGTIDVGSGADLDLSITNSGDTTLAGDVTESCDHYSVVSGGGPYVLAPGETLPVTVRFEPLYPGSHGCVIETGSTGCSQINCTGDAVGTPSCWVSKTALDFGAVSVGESADLDFTVLNNGTTILAGTVSEPCNHYSVLAGGGPYTLYPGESVTVTVRFRPLTKGEHECVVETGDGECSDVSCSGRGAGPRPNNNGKWALHFAGDHNSKANTCDFAVADCQNVDVDAPAGAGRYDVYVLALDVDAIAGTRYGVACDGPFYFYGWTKCSDFEIPTAGWPACGEANAQTWSVEQAGPHVTIGILDVYSYGGSVSLSTCPDPRVGFAEWCNGEQPSPICTQTTYSAAFGAIGFGVPGYNPCSVIPVGLAGFDAIATVDGVLLNWESSSFDRFFVCRSAAGRDGNYVRLHEEPIETGPPTEGRYSYLDEGVIPGTLYYYKIEALQAGGGSVFFGPYSVRAADLKAGFSLSQNYPNPFRRGGVTTIEYSVQEACPVAVRIIDAAGRLVKEIKRNAGPGTNTVIWNGTDEEGRRVPSGVYFYEIRASDFAAKRKMVIVD